MPPLLAIEGLRAGYGQIEVLKEISLQVEEGEVVTIIGANGAGKSTTLMCISGCVPCRGGRILFGGEPIDGLPAHAVVRRGICQSPEGRKVFARLTVKENLLMGSFTRSDKEGIQSDVNRVMQLFPILKERERQLAGTLSGGEQQMLAVARALMGRPKLLLLDEPSLGLAPLIVKKIFEVVAELNRQGIAILLVEQNAKQALQLAKRGYVLETGSISIQGESSTLLKDPRVQAAYLGA